MTILEWLLDMLVPGRKALRASDEKQAGAKALLDEAFAAFNATIEEAAAQASRDLLPPKEPGND